MDKFPEKENINEEEEFSTIFSDPEQHKTVVQKNGNKKRLKTVITALVAVAVLVSGTFAVVKLIPKKTDDTNTPALEEIEVLSQSNADYKNVTVKNKNGSFKFYSVVTKAEDKESEDTVDWYMDGYDKAVVNTSSISQIVSSLTEISASREITEKTLEECGLENPVAKADIVTQDNGKFSVLIGNKSPDNSGVYLKLSTKDTIYLIPDSIDTILTFTELDLANADALEGLKLSDKYSSYTSEGTLSSFDSLTVSGKNFEKPVVIEANTDHALASYMPYIITSPTKRAAENNEDLFALFSSGVTVSGAYSFDVSSSTLSSLGLDNPDFVATIKILDFTYTYKFKLQSDGDYAVIGDDSVMVKKVSADSCKYLGYSTTDFYSTLVFMESIENISNLTLKTADKTYSFDITKNAESEDDDDQFLITYEGKNDIKSSEFQTFYRFCISLMCSDFTTDTFDADEALSITYTYKDKSITPVKISFKKASATKYQYTIDGTAMGKINASEFIKVDKYLQQLISGKTVTFNWFLKIAKNSRYNSAVFYIKDKNLY